MGLVGSGGVGEVCGCAVDGEADGDDVEAGSCAKAKNESDNILTEISDLRNAIEHPTKPDRLASESPQSTQGLEDGGCLVIGRQL